MQRARTPLHALTFHKIRVDACGEKCRASLSLQADETLVESGSLWVEWQFLRHNPRREWTSQDLWSLHAQDTTRAGLQTDVLVMTMITFVHKHSCVAATTLPLGYDCNSFTSWRADVDCVTIYWRKPTRTELEWGPEPPLSPIPLSKSFLTGSFNQKPIAMIQTLRPDGEEVIVTHKEKNPSVEKNNWVHFLIVHSPNTIWVRVHIS